MGVRTLVGTFVLLKFMSHDLPTFSWFTCTTIQHQLKSSNFSLVFFFSLPPSRSRSSPLLLFNGLNFLRYYRDFQTNIRRIKFPNGVCFGRQRTTACTNIHNYLLKVKVCAYKMRCCMLYTHYPTTTIHFYNL